MKRMFAMEAVILHKYLRQMIFTSIFVAACVTLGGMTLASVPLMMCFMVTFGAMTSLSAYDEQNSWASYRLTMPVSKRDVVFGRYAFIACIAFCFSMAATLVCLLLSVLGWNVELPDFLNAMLLSSTEDLIGLAALYVMGIGMASLLASICLPAFFALGQTKATQWLPLIMLALGVAPIFALDYLSSEMIELGQALELLLQPSNLLIVCAGVLVAATALYVISAFVSVRLYERREL